ncbi:MAG: hypothetical protein CMJ64_06025 [Planctomycetaceae bacterium]|nr:hypothetical protein [Planctomycetaceae bacterium]
MTHRHSFAALLRRCDAGLRTFPLVLFAGVITCCTSNLLADEPTLEFSRDVLPLLSENCFKCHGPDEGDREAGLRLDRREGTLAKLGSGMTAVLPGKSEQSEVFKRITTSDPELRMPPPDSGKTLSPAEISQITKWIDSGAEWSGHWAFQPPQKAASPAAIEGWHQQNPIDLFIQARVKAAKLAPEAVADKETLIRRVALDLTGLPPTVREIDDFLADESMGAYEHVVDRLLQSKAYGEHMARHWLDAARYADTHGLHLDNERSIWPYRDWVINAFNRNMPFDQFTIEQLAGDLLPSPTLEQRVATGFNRCNVTTNEGGSIDDEYYVRYAVDRVETTATVWLGLTAGCAACHDHKFDPLTQKEFYQLFSYYFSLTERAMDGNALLPPPTVKVPTAEQIANKQKYQEQLAAVQKKFTETLAGLKYEDPLADAKLGPLEESETAWFDDTLPPGAKPNGNEQGASWKFVSAPDHPVLSGKNSSVRTAGKAISQHFFTDANPKLKLGPNTRLFTYVFLDPKNAPETIQLQFNDGTWEHRASWGADKAFKAGTNDASNRRMGKLPETGKWVRLEVAAEQVGLKDGSELNGWAFTQFGGTVHWDKAGRVTMSIPVEQQKSLAVWEQFRRQVKTPALPAELQKILDVEKAKRSPEQTTELTRYFLQHINPESRKLFAGPMKKEADLKKQIADIDAAIPSTLVMEDRKELRQAHILERGQYTLKRDPVSSNVPEWLAPAVADAPKNRMGLAKWLVSAKHPLTARVTVNRLWQQYFGIGLVRTAEDFGVQGEQPSHPRLLDWLAVDFVESGWDVKRFQKQLVMSATYKQSSRVTAGKLAADPENRLLARGPRFRLDAEIIRDQSLAISGLLIDTVGGKSVRPYQPAGLWKPVGFGGSNTSVFKQDTGSKLYRRSMYTFWKRTSPPPSMTTFDAPDRETCQVRRARTNTPLQALVLMNDVQFIEAARKFAERVIKEGGSDAIQRMVFAFRSVTARQPSSIELESLGRLFGEYRSEFQSDPDAAQKLLAAGESPRDESLELSEVGAWTMITHLLFNLSETVTKG